MRPRRSRLAALKHVPRAAFLLGWAGVIPFAGLSLAAALDLDLLPAAPQVLLVGYGACILSFMGGAQWGLTTAGPLNPRSGLRFGSAVLPALLAWLTLFLAWKPALCLLAAGFGLLLAYDLATVRAGLAPPWYGALRIQLTAAVILLLLAALL